MRGNYIVFDTVYPVVFSEALSHEQVSVLDGKKPTSRGKFTISIRLNEIVVSVDGAQSLPSDANLIKIALCHVLFDGKYVVFDHTHTLMFSAAISHDNITVFNRPQPSSAGFLRIGIGDGRVSLDVFGDSNSLNLNSNPEDADLIKIALCHGA